MSVENLQTVYITGIDPAESVEEQYVRQIFQCNVWCLYIYIYKLTLLEVHP